MNKGELNLKKSCFSKEKERVAYWRGGRPSRLNDRLISANL